MAHTLKGGALSLGATELAEVFKTCERRLADGTGLDDQARADMVAQLQGAAQRAITAMQDAIGRLEAPLSK